MPVVQTSRQRPLRLLTDGDQLVVWPGGAAAHRLFLDGGSAPLVLPVPTFGAVLGWSQGEFLYAWSTARDVAQVQVFDRAFAPIGGLQLYGGSTSSTSLRDVAPAIGGFVILGSDRRFLVSRGLDAGWQRQRINGLGGGSGIAATHDLGHLVWDGDLGTGWVSYTPPDGGAGSLEPVLMDGGNQELGNVVFAPSPTGALTVYELSWQSAGPERDGYYVRPMGPGFRFSSPPLRVADRQSLNFFSPPPARAVFDGANHLVIARAGTAWRLLKLSPTGELLANDAGLGTDLDQAAMISLAPGRTALVESQLDGGVRWRTITTCP